MRNAALGNLGILVVEDEPLLRKQLAAYLQKHGAEAASADSVRGARALLEETVFDFALLDVNLPDGLGTDLLKGKFISTNTGVIVMTAEGGITGAVEAMRLGALEYLVKPFDLAELPLVIGRARQAKQAARLDEHRRGDASVSGETFYFGSSLSILKGQLAKILAADARMQGQLPPVLIEGETGTREDDDRTLVASPWPSRPQASGRNQLLGVTGNFGGVGVVRTRAGCLHRCQDRTNRTLRGRERRNVISRRIAQPVARFASKGIDYYRRSSDSARRW